MRWPRRLSSAVPAGAAAPARLLPLRLALGRYYRTAQVIAGLAIIPDLIWLLQGEFSGAFQGPSLGPWAFWVLLNLAPVLAMTAFHRDTPRTSRFVISGVCMFTE